VSSAVVVTWMSHTCRCSREVTEKLSPVLPVRLNELVTNCMYVVVQCVGVDVRYGSFCPINYLIYAHFSSSCVSWSLISIQSDVQFGIDVRRSQSDRLLQRSCRVRQSRYLCTQMAWPVYVDNDRCPTATAGKRRLIDSARDERKVTC
jgi:hypothetical protein